MCTGMAWMAWVRVPEGIWPTALNILTQDPIIYNTVQQVICFGPLGSFRQHIQQAKQM
jgi:hypothetical protein